MTVDSRAAIAHRILQYRKSRTDILIVDDDVVLLSGEPNLAQTQAELGVVSSLVKPCNLPELLTVLQRLLPPRTS